MPSLGSQQRQQQRQRRLGRRRRRSRRRSGLPHLLSQAATQLFLREGPWAGVIAVAGKYIKQTGDDVGKLSNRAHLNDSKETKAPFLVQVLKDGSDDRSELATMRQVHQEKILHCAQCT